MSLARLALPILTLAAIVLGAASAPAAESYDVAIRPLIERYCVKCHGAEKAKAGVNVAGGRELVDLLKERRVWWQIVEQLRSGEMPPKEPLPTDVERERMIQWIEHTLTEVDWNVLHDPGRLSLARLTAVEYGNGIREIFGVDLQAGDLLGKDPEGGTGFTNDRESLTFPRFAFGDFMREAERAVEAFLAFGRDRWSISVEMEEAWKQVSDKSTELSKDGREVVLKDRNAPLQLNLDLPFAGMYRFAFTARPFAGEPMSGVRLVANGRPVERLLIAGAEPREYAIVLHLDAGANVLSLGYDPERAPILQPKIQPRVVPKEIARMAKRPAVKPFPIPARFERDAEAVRAWERMNNVIRVFTETRRLAELLIERGETDYEKHPLADGTAASAIAGFRTTKVPFNLSAGKVAVYLKIPQAKLEQQIEAETGFAHGDYIKAARRYNEAFRRKHPGRVQKQAGRVALDRFTIHSHALTPTDVDPAWAFADDDGTERSALRLGASLAERAYGRTADATELSALRDIYRATRAETRSHREGLRDALVGLLVSPPFLLHYTPADASRRRQVTDHDLARRLARFLWLSLPDAPLRALAASGRLREPTQLRTTVDRMIDDPKFDAVASLFVDQWLNLESLAAYEESRQVDFSTVVAMRHEPALLLRHVFRANRPLTELIAADYTFLNASLARHYDIPEVTAHDMELVRLSDNRRGGLLAMGGMHTVTSTPERTSPVTRGAWIVELILGEELPPAPASVPELKTNNKARTVREELELHRSVKECAGCHRRIDPYGFVLEHYDQFGAWREVERRKPVNAATVLPDDTAVNGLTEFRDYVIARRRDHFVRNVAERFMEFALGRELRFSDERAMREIVAAVSRDGDRARSLIHAIVSSEQFRIQSDETVQP